MPLRSYRPGPPPRGGYTGRSRNLHRGDKRGIQGGGNNERARQLRPPWLDSRSVEDGTRARRSKEPAFCRGGYILRPMPPFQWRTNMEPPANTREDRGANARTGVRRGAGG